jgi:hypothetical protein
MNIRGLLILSFIITFYSCKDIKGVIEERQKGCADLNDSKKVYLVNTSTSTKYTFTVKTTDRINNSIIQYSTKKITLAPGDETELGCTLYFTDHKYSTSEKINIIKTVDDLPDLNVNKNVIFSDTFIERKNMKYAKIISVDSCNLISQNKHSVLYQVTGQASKQSDKK